MTAVTILQPNKSLAIAAIDASLRGPDSNSFENHNMRLTSSPTTLPFSYFSATSLAYNATLIYIYYQLNDTSMGEIVYNTVENAWSSQPIDIPFF